MRSGTAEATARADAGVVLVIEDDHDVRVLIRQTLEAEGYTVLSVTDGKSALELLAATTKTPSLILLDLRLPLMNGWRFVEHVRRIPEHANIPIVVMSLLDDPTLPPGTKGFLYKPVRREALLRTVAQHRMQDKGPQVVQTDEFPPLPDDEAAQFALWRTTQPQEGEGARWESADGRWIAIRVGGVGNPGTMLVSDSSGRSQSVDSYERALELALSWQQQARSAG